MIIHVVQEGEDLDSISEQYSTTVTRIIQENELQNPRNLVVGQCLIITDPQEVYIVQEGDTLESIARTHDITLIQLYANNPFLIEREFIYPGEVLIIQYNRDKGNITVHGIAFPFIGEKILRRTLPFLTYLSIMNYTTLKDGKIRSYYDDIDVIRMSKEFGVMPLMLITTSTLQGKPNIEIAYDILLNKEHQNQHIDSVIAIVKEKGYYGVNIAFQYMSLSNFRLYESFLLNIHKKLSEEESHLFVTIKPNIEFDEPEKVFLIKLIIHL